MTNLRTLEKTDVNLLILFHVFVQPETQCNVCFIIYLSHNLFTCLKRIAHFCSFLNLTLAFDKAVKVTKSGHHLVHDRTSKGYKSFPGLTSQTSLHACLQRLTTMQIIF